MTGSTRVKLIFILALMAALCMMLSPVGAALVRRFDGVAVGTSGITNQGNTTLGDASNDTTTVAGNATCNVALTVNGNATLGDATNDIVTVAGNETVNGALSTLGNATFGDNAADTVTAAGNVTCNSVLTVAGNVALNGSALAIGNASTDVATCTGRLVLRTLGSDPLDATPGNRPAGTVAEVAYYSGVVYACTNADTPLWVKVGPES